MGASVETVFIETYENTVRHLAQQGVTRLRPWVMEKSVQSEAHNWERLGTREALEKTQRLQPTPNQDYPFSRRKSTPKTWDTGDSTEQEDIVQLLIEPNSNIAEAQAKAMKRAVDKAIIAAAVGDSMDEDNQPITYDPAQAIGAQGAPVPMTYDLVTHVAEIFMDNDIEPEEEKVFVVSPRQARKIMQLTEATSSDYNHARDLVTKYYVKNWMGFTWIVSTLLPDSSAGQDNSENHIFAMTKKAIGLQMNRDLWAKVGEDISYSFAWRIYAASTFGAIRVEDKQLVRVNCSTTI